MVDLSLVGVAIAWGSSYLAAKEVATPDNVFGFLSVRFAIATACLALAMLPRLLRASHQEFRLGASYGVILAAIFVLETFGVTQTTASNAGLIISLTMVLTPLLEGVVQGRALPRQFYSATALAVAGVGVLTQAAGFAAPKSGDLLILLAAIARAIHVTVIAHTSRGHHVDSARMTWIQLVTCLGAFTALSFVLGENTYQTARAFDAVDWALTLYLAIAATVFAFVVQMWAVRRTSPSRVSLLLGTEPVWAALIGISIGGDPWTWATAVGAGLVVLGTNWGRSIEATRLDT